MHRASLAATLTIGFALGGLGCGKSGPTQAQLDAQEASAYRGRVASERKRLSASGLGGALLERSANDSARLLAGARARKLMDGGDEKRGRAAARAAGFDPDQLKAEDPNDFK